MIAKLISFKLADNVTVYQWYKAESPGYRRSSLGTMN